VDFRRAEDGKPTLVRERSLEVLIASLRRLADLELREVLPGHGEPFGGHRSVVDERLRHHERRKEAVAAVLRDRGPCPAFEVALALFPEQAEPMGRFLALSEVLGHLDLLEADGVVRRQADGGVDLYSPA
jgi:glyoxylase-like metal-dependent hydrolase (beta-lactamase superfamily II)